MRKPFALALGALLLGVAAPAAAADPAVAARALQEVCVAHAGSAAAARAAALAAGFLKGQSLPPLTRGGGAFEGYRRDALELVIRESKSGSFGCMILFPPDAAVGNAAVANAVTALPGLTLKSSKGSEKKWRGHWVPAAALEGSEVILTIHHGIGERMAILSLESKAKK